MWQYKILGKKKKRKLLFLKSFDFKEPSTISKNEYKDERIEALYKAISKLDKVEKAIMMLHLDEVANDEIAEIVGITQNYVRVKMSRIRTKLAETIKTN